MAHVEIYIGVKSYKSANN